MIALLLTLVLVSGQAATSPYQGEESRPIKALSPQQIDGYLNARGMGLARAAELNRYPGPMHVLELRQELALSPEQVTEAQAIFDEMKAAATKIGRAIVEEERQLDDAFAQGTVDEALLAEKVHQIGRLQAELRLIHLRAHVRMRPVLSAGQIEAYDRLRGYRSAP